MLLTLVFASALTVSLVWVIGLIQCIVNKRDAPFWMFICLVLMIILWGMFYSFSKFPG